MCMNSFLARVYIEQISECISTQSRRRLSSRQLDRLYVLYINNQQDFLLAGSLLALYRSKCMAMSRLQAVADLDLRILFDSLQ